METPISIKRKADESTTHELIGETIQTFRENQTHNHQRTRPTVLDEVVNRNLERSSKIL